MVPLRSTLETAKLVVVVVMVDRTLDVSPPVVPCLDLESCPAPAAGRRTVRSKPKPKAEGCVIRVREETPAAVVVALVPVRPAMMEAAVVEARCPDEAVVDETRALLTRLLVVLARLAGAATRVVRDVGSRIPIEANT